MSNKLSIYCKIYVKVYPDAAQHYAENLKLHDLRYPKSIVTFSYATNKKYLDSWCPPAAVSSLLNHILKCFSIPMQIHILPPSHKSPCIFSADNLQETCPLLIL